MNKTEKTSVLSGFGEKVVETKACKQCNARFEITDKDLEFYKKVSPVFDIQKTGLQKRPVLDNEFIKDLGNGKMKYLVPTPSLCPNCRFIRRASFRNLRYLYKRNCDATGKQIISIYSPDKPYKVYDQEFWWDDRWGAMGYCVSYNFEKNFFYQFSKLLRDVPKIALSTEKLENSKYVNYSGRIKNCYLVFISGYDEDCYYSYGLRYSKNCLDCSYSQYLENCYEVSDSLNCTDSFYLTNSKDCNNCYYSDNLIGSEFCLFSSNLVNKKYFLLNKEIGKQEFKNILKDINNNKDIFNDYFVRYKDLCFSVPKKCNYNIFSKNCVGEYILNSKNVFNGFDLSEVYDCKYVDRLFESKDCYDVYDWGETAERCHECYKIGKGVSNTIFSAFCINNINNLIYCYDCVNNCSSCFGCIGLKNKSYCILNKQYTKEEYNRLVPKIIEHMQKTGEWGEFFPSSLSPFGYNETVAQEYFPIEIKTSLNKKDIKYIDRQGNTYKDLKEAGERLVFKYSSYEAAKPKVDKIIPANKLPENIRDIPDDILNRAIECEITKKPFRIIKEELEFYRKHNLPIPRRHPDQRHLDRMALRNPRKLYDRNCDKCGKEIKTIYSPERLEKVYCEECYNKEIY